jgi:hypothetical protein
MQRAIRNLQTGKFYAHGEWTAELWLAQKFTDEESLETVVKDNGLQDIEMVFLTEDERRIRGGIRIEWPP